MQPGNKGTGEPPHVFLRNRGREQTAWQPALAVRMSSQPYGEILPKQPGSISGASLLSAKGCETCVHRTSSPETVTDQQDCSGAGLCVQVLQLSSSQSSLWQLHPSSAPSSPGYRSSIPQESPCTTCSPALTILVTLCKTLSLYLGSKTGHSIQMWLHQCQIKGNNHFL